LSASVIGMQKKHLFLLIVFIFVTLKETSSQRLPALGKTGSRMVPDVEQPSLHVAPVIYYKPATILLNLHDTISEIVYWRRNFTDQFLEVWSDSRMYPASMIFGFVQDSIYFRSTMDYDYHIFAPMIFKGPVSLYYTRYIQNLGEIRMISGDPKNPDYQNRMIVTGDVPRRYANEFTYFVTFPWDTLKMIPVTRKSLQKFANTYLRAYPEAYEEARTYDVSSTDQVLNYGVIPVAVIGTAAFLLDKGNPVYFLGIGVGALITYISVKLFVKPRMLDPEAMIGIVEKCR
jgi:hypothetical protein